MINEIEFKEQLNKIRENEVIEINSWWGLRSPGYEGTIITQNKEVYRYQYYHFIPDESNDTNCNYINKIKDLNDDEYKKVIMFIEKEIINKEFTDIIIYDAGFDVSINYNGIKKTIINNKGFKDDLQLYDKAQILFKEVIKDNRNNKETEVDGVKEETKPKKNRKWKILLFIGSLPFVIILSIGIFSIFGGFTFFFDTSYGIEAFCGSIFILSFLFWPTYIVGAVLMVLSIIKLKQKK